MRFAGKAAQAVTQTRNTQCFIIVRITVSQKVTIKVINCSLWLCAPKSTRMESFGGEFKKTRKGMYSFKIDI